MISIQLLLIFRQSYFIFRHDYTWQHCYYQQPELVYVLLKSSLFNNNKNTHTACSHMPTHAYTHWDQLWEPSHLAPPPHTHWPQFSTHLPWLSGSKRGRDRGKKKERYDKQYYSFCLILRGLREDDDHQSSLVFPHTPTPCSSHYCLRKTIALRWLTIELFLIPITNQDCLTQATWLAMQHGGERWRLNQSNYFYQANPHIMEQQKLWKHWDYFGVAECTDIDKCGFSPAVKTQHCSRSVPCSSQQEGF